MTDGDDCRRADYQTPGGQQSGEVEEMERAEQLGNGAKRCPKQSDRPQKSVPESVTALNGQEQGGESDNQEPCGHFVQYASRVGAASRSREPGIGERAMASRLLSLIGVGRKVEIEFASLWFGWRTLRWHESSEAALEVGVLRIAGQIMPFIRVGYAVI